MHMIAHKRSSMVGLSLDIQLVQTSGERLEKWSISRLEIFPQKCVCGLNLLQLCYKVVVLCLPIILLFVVFFFCLPGLQLGGEPLMQLS